MENQPYFFEVFQFLMTSKSKNYTIIVKFIDRGGQDQDMFPFHSHYNRQHEREKGSIFVRR